MKKNHAVSPEGILLIKRFEGFSATPYLCPAGYWTIGYGHLLKNIPSPAGGEGLGWGNNTVTITEPQAEALLFQDIRRTESTVSRLIPVALTQGQFDALVSFTYNLGAGALQRSTLRQKVHRAEHENAVLEFPKWVYAGGRKLPGLVKRRAQEAIFYQN